jgi:hypothetical protein
MRARLPVIAIASAVVIVSAAAAATADSGAGRDDPFVWLEQVIPQAPALDTAIGFVNT